MTLILPGVEISVVKEIVTGQLNPAGILGLIGLCEDGKDGKPRVKARASSYKAFKDLFGRSIDYSVPEAKQAFQNGISEICFVPLASASAQAAELTIKDANGKDAAVVKARCRGTWGNDINITIENKEVDGVQKCKFIIKYKNATEIFDNLVGKEDDDRYYIDIINAGSDMVTLEKKSGELPATLVEGYLSGGINATMKDYENALEELEMEPDVDLVCATVMDYKDLSFVKQLYANVEAHCKTMSLAAMNRIGFGQVPPADELRHQNEEAKEIINMTLTLSSDRFVLVAPHGVLGAVMGLIGSLKYYESPTYKTISGVSGLARNYTPSNLKEMLKANVLLLEAKRGKGIIVEKGISTSGEQISVTRIADRAVRGVKMIGDAFIGTLNTHLGRNALKEKITEFFLQMEKDGAIQPNSAKTDPAFKVDVYASDDDIAKGIVRVDIAVRPVRAIDYIYGTILVRA